MEKSKWIGSPNFTKGRYTYKPEYIVIHIMEGTLNGTDSWFNNPSSHVSAHSGVGSNGEVHDYVHSVDTAWHCGTTSIGKATFKGFKQINGKLVNTNLYCLGLEHEGTHDKEITEECYLASARKIKFWGNRFNIPIDAEHIVTHSSIYPGHNCPASSINLNKLIEYAIKADPIEPA